MLAWFHPTVEKCSYFHVFSISFMCHSWGHYERESSRIMVNCCIFKLWACSFCNRRILWIQPEVVLQEFPDALAINKKCSWNQREKQRDCVSRSFIRVIATAKTRRVLCEQWRSKSMKLQETKLWKCNKWLIRMARFWEVSTFWLVQTTSKDWLRNNMWFQGLGLDFLSIRC